MPLIVLRELQSNLELDIFDLTQKWIGTSAGAVICSSLLIQRGTEPFIQSVQDVLDIYEFRSQSAINPGTGNDPSRALYKIFDKNFGSYRLSDFPELNIVTCSRSPIESVVFNANNDCNLSQAIKASCAVPGVFEKVKIGDSFYVDGFLRAKNPGLLSIQNEELNDDLVVLSLGSGVLRVDDAIEQQVKHTHMTMLNESEKQGFHYFRFDPLLEKADDSMQNTSLKNIFNLKKDAEMHLIKNKEDIQRFASLFS